MARARAGPANVRDTAPPVALSGAPWRRGREGGADEDGPEGEAAGDCGSGDAAGDAAGDAELVHSTPLL